MPEIPYRDIIQNGRNSELQRKLETNTNKLHIKSSIKKWKKPQQLGFVSGAYSRIFNFKKYLKIKNKTFRTTFYRETSVYIAYLTTIEINFNT